MTIQTIHQTNQKSTPQTLGGQRIDNFILTVWEPLDLLGQRLLGDLWRIVYLTLQDAIALSILFAIPALIGGSQDNLEECLKESLWDIDRYSCVVIWLSDFCLWIVLTGRTIIRCWRDLKTLGKS
ncbi:MAG TPA: hypothetical protein DDZ80_22445 [Cyanobacteria bacterium UBA8803]|nr:hypothetical protein [Cyanobacteria bacterium UBA9273]HBL61087.1 hypothetical protein [Cyanobacteria bacterium UBA8803]